MTQVGTYQVGCQIFFRKAEKGQVFGGENKIILPSGCDNKKYQNDVNVIGIILQTT